MASEYFEYDGRVFFLPNWPDPEMTALGVPQADINAARRAVARGRIDAAAGRARTRFVSPGALVAEEYRAARDAVKRWRDAGSPANDVPAEIVSGAEYSGLSHEQAAVEIEQTAQAYEQGLAEIRDARLAGKRAVSQADGAEIDAAADVAIAELDAIQPPSV